MLGARGVSAGRTMVLWQTRLHGYPDICPAHHPLCGFNMQDGGAGHAADVAQQANKGYYLLLQENYLKVIMT